MWVQPWSQPCTKVHPESSTSFHSQKTFLAFVPPVHEGSREGCVTVLGGFTDLLLEGVPVVRRQQHTHTHTPGCKGVGSCDFWAHRPPNPVAPTISPSTCICASSRSRPRFSLAATAFPRRRALGSREASVGPAAHGSTVADANTKNPCQVRAHLPLAGLARRPC